MNSISAEQAVAFFIETGGSVLIIQASNIHHGGGRILLEEVLRSAALNGQKIILLVDRRFEVKRLNLNIEVYEIKPSILDRLKAEFFLRKLALNNPEASILCFGNLPPLLNMPKKVTLFFQNVIMLKHFSHFMFTFSTRKRQAIERIWIKIGMRNVEKVVVQTPTVKDFFLKEYPLAQVIVCPFFINELSADSNFTVNRNQLLTTEKSFDFVYVSSGDPHKNHAQLLEAWSILASEGHFPSLMLTVESGYQNTLKLIAQGQSHGLKIQNVPSATRENVLELYQKSVAAIFPSLCESFGLPLLEAKAFGLPILAPELDYIRDIVIPAESFDPTSARSIARAVKRYLHIEDPLLKVNSAMDFVNQVCSNLESAIGLLSCPVCKSRGSEKVQAALGLSYSRCLTCGYEHQIVEGGATVTNFDHAQELYYEQDDLILSKPVRTLNLDRSKVRMKIVKKYLNQGSLLEIGPGTGEFLELAKAEGFAVEAVEHAKRLAKYIREDLKIKTYESNLEDLDLGGQKYDSLYSSHVIEHVVDPTFYLSMAKKIVRPGGYFFIMTPNGDCWEHDFVGRAWSMYTMAHLHIFTSKSLSLLLKNAGWEVEAVKTPEYAVDWIRAIISFVFNRAPGPIPKPGNNIRKMPDWVAISLMRFVSFILWPLSVVQSSSQKGGELFIIARRPIE